MTEIEHLFDSVQERKWWCEMVAKVGTLVRPAGPGAAVHELLGRARHELGRAQEAVSPEERVRCAHLSALRAGAALVAARQVRGVRSRPRSVWELVERAAPELGPWSAYFASSASLRAAVESGRSTGLTWEDAEHVASMAAMFLDIVEPMALGVDP